MTNSTNNNISKARNILVACLDSVDGSPCNLTLSEAKELMQDIIDNVVTCEEVDHNLYVDGGEVRIISEDHIDSVWTESLINQIEECYAEVSALPSFIEIDWNATVENCKHDGMGHHFNSYDGNEHNAENVYIFRTN